MPPRCPATPPGCRSTRTSPITLDPSLTRRTSASPRCVPIAPPMSPAGTSASRTSFERIMGLPPMNQQDAMAPLMFDCFTNTPDFTPYTTLPNNIPLAEGTTVSGPLSPKQRAWAKKLQKMDFSKPDRINDDLFNRYVWFTIKGDARYPSQFVGGH